MNRHFSFHVVCVALLATLAAAACDRAWGSAPAAELPRQLDLFVGDSRVLAVRTSRVAVGNGKIVSATPISASQLVLIGQSAGTTVLQLWMRDGSRQRVLVTVSSNDLDSTLVAVRELIGNMSGIAARISGRRIVIEGDSAGAQARERAAFVAALYPGVVLDFVGKLGWERMVHVDVRIVEFRRGRLRELGIRWREDINGPNAGIIADFVANDRFRPIPPDTGLPQGLLEAQVTPVSSAARFLGLATTLDSRIRLLEQRGEATIVAEPMLSCRSGGSARFVAGGEIPVPVVNGVGSTDIEYREYGVILDIKPVADLSGAIFARVETEISRIDNAQRVLGVPGLLKRRSAADINLRDGETLVIAGLTNRERSIEGSGLPGVSNLPVAGRLFGSRARRSDDSELVIFLTPRIVQAEPVDPSATQLTGADPAEPALRRAREIIQSLPAVQ